MKFIGENLLPGNLGHFFVIFSLVASLIAAISFFIASSAKLSADEKNKWQRLGTWSFLAQSVGVVIVFTAIFYICYNHLYEYMYAYKHASRELEMKYLLACIWEGQEGSFLLWTIWQAVLGLVFVYAKRIDNKWKAPVMSIVSATQFFLLMMILGVYFFGVEIGNSPFTLTRNEIPGPIFSDPNYLNFIKDGLGLNVLLRNYWMVIHPPVLFLGFASSLLVFAFALAALRLKDFTGWVKPALPWMLFGVAVLGVGIMMGGKWAYESLSFGGYWGWDPVENASLVPWMMMVAGLHTMLIYKATGHSLRASYFFAFCGFIFVLYSTFLTRTGILGETSVHSFTEAGTAINIMIGIFVLFFVLLSLVSFAMYYKKIPALHQEESFNSREFWMYVGALVIFLTAAFIIIKTSAPVYNKVFGASLAPAEEVEFSYNKVVILSTIIIGILTAFIQYLKYKSTEKNYLLKGIVVPTVIAAVLTLLVSIFYPFQFHKHGAGFLAAIYVAFFAGMYALIANGYYLFKFMKGNLLKGGGSIAHFGFAMMVVGILISSANKVVISDAKANGILMPGSIDPMTKKADNPTDNLTLVKDVPTIMGNFVATYVNDSAGHEKGRKFYRVDYVSKDNKEKFYLQPDVYVMKDNNMSSNPDIKNYLTHDIFSFISFAMNKSAEEDTAQFKISDVAPGDSVFLEKGYLKLDEVVKNPNNNKYKYTESDLALMARISFYNENGLAGVGMPVIEIGKDGHVHFVDDTLQLNNTYLRFAGVADQRKIKLGIKESKKMRDFITVKTFIFPYINFVWLGLVLMAVGTVISMVHRGKFSKGLALTVILGSLLILGYLFLIAN